VENAFLQLMKGFFQQTALVEKELIKSWRSKG